MPGAPASKEHKGNSGSERSGGPGVCVMAISAAPLDSGRFSRLGVEIRVGVRAPDSSVVVVGFSSNPPFKRRNPKAGHKRLANARK